MSAQFQTITRSRDAHIPSLDGIRALAAAWVFSAHSGLQHVLPGSFGVTIFFFLSGYLITTLLRLEYESTGAISLKKFYLRRAYRILPPMYLVFGLAIALCLIGIVPGHMTPGAVAAQLGHLTNYYTAFHGIANIIPGTGIMWSLAVEEHFYLLYPIALMLLLKRYDLRRIAAILACICIATVLWRCCLILQLHAPEDYLYVATDARMGSLLYGCILGVWSNPSLDRPVVRLGSWAWSFVLGLAVVLLLESFQLSGRFGAIFEYSLQGIALLPIFYCAIRFSDWPIFRWLGFKWVRGLGLVSYTFYLSHISALRVARHYFPHHPHRTALIAFIATVAFSAGMYFFVERYFAALRHRLHRQAQAAPSRRESTVPAR